MIGDKQNDFTRGKSCLKVLVVFCDGLRALVDKTTDIISLDLQKAFDNIQHNILVNCRDLDLMDGWMDGWPPWSTVFSSGTYKHKQDMDLLE